MIYEVKPTTKFAKDLKKIKKRGYDILLLTDIIKQLASGETLQQTNKDHPLTGNFGHLRECHITPDWLLVYEKSEKTLILYLTRTGSHSDLY